MYFNVFFSFRRLILVGEEIYLSNSFSLKYLWFIRVSSSFSYRDTCVPLLPFSYTIFFFPISFQQIYPVLAVFVSLSPRLHDVKPSGTVDSFLSICAKKSRGPAWHGDATQQNGRSSHARHNKSFTMKNHLEEMGRNFCFLRFFKVISKWTSGRIKMSIFGIDIERLELILIELLNY